jgi:hypothetical protein
MKARLFILFALIVGLALLLVGNVAAQGPMPSGHEPSAHSRTEHPSPHSHGADAESKISPHPAASSSAGGVNAAALGAPGTVYRYTTTFGDPQAPYLSTTNHLNHPGSLAVDKANNVYVGETDGHRVLKFNSGGTFQAQIGYTGVCDARDSADSGICGAWGLGIGPNGNVWIAEISDRVSVFTYTTTSFAYLDQVGVTWEDGYDDEHLYEPEGVAFDSAGRMYVADWGNDRVQIFDSSGAYSATLDGFDYPSGLAISSDDTLYVADTENGCVQVYHLEGDSMVYDESICSYDGTNFQWVNAVAVDDSHLYVADETEPDDNGYIHVFDRSSGNYLSTIDGDCGGSRDWFCSPYDVAVDSNGYVYVADPWEHYRVMKCSGGPNWTCTRFAGTKDVPYISDGSHYNDPHGVAVDGAGNLLLTEYDGDRLVKLNSAGTFQWQVGTPGVWGSDNAHFDGPEHVAVASSGRVYVADSWNNRIQVFNSNGSYFATLGSGDCGYSDTEFCWPTGVAVGGDGRIYVADADNWRVQKCTLGSGGSYSCSTVGDYSDFDYPVGVAVDSNNNVYVADEGQSVVEKCTPGGGTYSCAIFAGTPYEWGDDFDHFDGLYDVAEAGGKVFVADTYNHRIQVFNTSGAYLTTIGGSAGSRTGELNYPEAVDVDAAGNVYVADSDNSRIQKFSPGVPGASQININGFGDRSNVSAHRMQSFAGYLYVGTWNENTGGEVWRSADGTSWSQVNTDGFGNEYNTNALVGEAMAGYLYVGTTNAIEGAEIWRCQACDGSDWSRVMSGGFGDTSNTSLERIVVFSDTLYATTANGTTGAEVWQSSSGASGSWTQSNADGFGDDNNTAIWAAAVFDGHLYVATAQIDVDTPTGVEVWRTDGTAWSQINADGFGDADNVFAWLEPFDGNLYALTNNYTTSAQVWRCADCASQSDWARVVDDGFGDSNNYAGSFMLGFDGKFYAGTNNEATGTEVWQTGNGVNWRQLSIDGFGDSSNWNIVSGVIFSDSLLLGTWNWAHGGEVWQMVNYDNLVHLPIVVK